MEKVDKAAFGRRVKARIDRLGVKPAAFAKQHGFDQQLIDRLIKGQTGHTKYLFSLAKTLLTSPEWLLYGDGPEEPPPRDMREQAVNIINNLPDPELPAAIQALQGIGIDRKKRAG